MNQQKQLSRLVNKELGKTKYGSILASMFVCLSFFSLSLSLNIYFRPWILAVKD